MPLMIPAPRLLVTLDSPTSAVVETIDAESFADSAIDAAFVVPPEM